MNTTLKTGCIIYNEKDNTMFNCDLKIDDCKNLIADGIAMIWKVDHVPDVFDLVITDRNPDPIVKSNGYITLTDLVIKGHSKEFDEFMWEWNSDYMKHLVLVEKINKTLGVEL